MPKPPPAAVVHQRGNATYYSGTVYLNSHDDTLKLKKLGFRSFEFDGRCFGSLKYKAEWTRSAVALPAPDYVNGMNYDVTIPERALIVGYYDDDVSGHGDDYSGGTSAYPYFRRHRNDASDYRAASIACHTLRG